MVIASGKIPETLAATSRQVAYTATTLARFIGWTLEGSRLPPETRYIAAPLRPDPIGRSYGNTYCEFAP